MKGPIVSAADRPLNLQDAELPNVADAILNWLRPMVFTYVQKSVVDFQVVETPFNTETQALIQPLKPRMLEMKPIGQRQWKWFTIHSLPNLQLRPDDVIYQNETQYRVMGVFDFAAYGYMEYQVVQDYTGQGPNQ